MHDPSSAEAELARFAADLQIGDIPGPVLDEAKRSLVNIFATALAGSREPAVEVAVRTLLPFSSRAEASLAGRSERVDAPTAAFVNAMGANVFDFDDTHEATIIHPAATVFASLFAHAETARLTGAQVLKGFVIGGEIECRIGNALTPYHYARGWHITSTCGVFGAAAGTGSLLGLSGEEMLEAFSAAAVQSSGLVEGLGTMAKSISVGGAARNGLLSALLARDGLTGPAAPLTGERGYLKVYADDPSPTALTDGLGSEWEIARNTYKPYPVGVVLNPVIDACLLLREEDGLKLEDIEAMEVTGHPLLRQRTDRAEVDTGRATQVSAQHAIAIVLLRGRAGLAEFSDEAAAETLKAGRPKLAFHDEPGRDIASIDLLVRTRDGRELKREIRAALGSARNPLSNAQLEAKLADAARLVGFARDTRRLAEAIWNIDTAEDAGEIMRLAALAS
ncbi:MmgE/PrpD family protein [Afifella sp. IM 167]|uniref:MmgE/PrpD family protein n=1 Tax=Afifella sp. IM 167 TaxID=2033586 RepID=UPI001CCDD06C|nr:MmgE/PrpD family protein [Afifella sp. IM 167]MBZ8134470.1 MmgE/PrpD family protein [Afifella sp. IM 167]